MLGEVGRDDALPRCRSTIARLQLFFLRVFFAELAVGSETRSVLKPLMIRDKKADGNSRRELAIPTCGSPSFRRS